MQHSNSTTCSKHDLKRKPGDEGGGGGRWKSDIITMNTLKDQKKVQRIFCFVKGIAYIFQV